MSSILKALKKLEEEKASRRDGTTHIASEILQGTSPTNSRPRWLLPALAVMALLLLGGISYPILHKQPKEIRTVAKATAPAEAVRPAQEQPPAPVQPVTVLLAPPATAKRPASPSATPARTAAVPPPRPASRQPVPATAAVQPSTPSAQPASPGKPVAPAQEKKSTTEQNGPVFSVSGIAWQKDSATRLAIINGQPLATGATIEGATIEEIMPDRVKFSHNKASFEVFLGKTGRPN